MIRMRRNEANALRELEPAKIRMRQIRATRNANFPRKRFGGGTKSLLCFGAANSRVGRSNLFGGTRTEWNAAMKDYVREKEPAQQRSHKGGGPQSKWRPTRELVKEVLIGENHVGRDLRGRPF